MAATLIDDKFSPAHRENDRNRTTRFYGVKFIESKLNEDKHYSSTTSSTTLVNPRRYFREVYGPFLCSLLLTSTLTIILGASLALAGYYVPRLTAESLVKNKFTESEAIDKVIEHDRTIRGLRIAGVVLLGVGGIGLSSLILAPLIFLHRNDYHTLPQTSNPPSPLWVSSGRTFLKKPEMKFDYSVVKQHIQPKKHKSTKKIYHHHRANYDQGFLSPELNRGPIFVSDETCRIGDQTKRSRAASFNPKPNSEYFGRERSVSSSKILSPDCKRTPVKAGSFHSLH